MPKPMTTARLALRRGRELLRRMAQDGRIVLFTAPDDSVGEEVRMHADRVGMPRVIGRWIGGTLTNHASILRGVRRLAEIEDSEADGRLDRRPPVEKKRILGEKRRLLGRFDGLRGMLQLPAALIVVKPTRQASAVFEAKKTRTLVIALPTRDLPCPSAQLSIQVDEEEMAKTVGRLADAVADGLDDRKERAEQPPGRQDDEGPGTASVPARLRPRPSPRSGRVRPDPD